MTSYWHLNYKLNYKGATELMEENKVFNKDSVYNTFLYNYMDIATYRQKMKTTLKDRFIFLSLKEILLAVEENQFLPCFCLL